VLSEDRSVTCMECTLHFYWRAKQKAFLSDSGEVMDAVLIQNCSIIVQNDEICDVFGFQDL